MFHINCNNSEDSWRTDQEQVDTISLQNKNKLIRGDENYKMYNNLRYGIATLIEHNKKELYVYLKSLSQYQLERYHNYISHTLNESDIDNNDMIGEGIYNMCNEILNKGTLELVEKAQMVYIRLLELYGNDIHTLMDDVGIRIY